MSDFDSRQSNIKRYKVFNGLKVRNLSDEYQCSENEEKNERTIVRQEPGLVRLGFVPNEWFEFFFKKTGVTGLGTFCFTVGTYVISKEYFIMEHEYYNGLSMVLLCAVFTKNFGPSLAKYLDKETDEYENALKNTREQDKQTIQKNIDGELKLQESAEAQLILIEAKRENVMLQREAAYRERCMIAYNETRKRLEYCAMRESIEKAFAKRSMTDWVVEEVRNAITEKIEDESLDKCMEILENLAEIFEKLEEPYPEEKLGSEVSNDTESDKY
ncbi:hypothetical protein FQR65_LT00793 [Abscondita terminalis]|nr:hypothetical protein FQR65_LT00793 [Abscondita terminalis]